MKFENNKAIFLQIADLVMEKIAKSEWQAAEKILSVRDLAAELEVNPNTVTRAYELLKQQEIIYNKRGLGFYVENQAAEKIHVNKKKHFLEVELPSLFHTMDVLSISIEEIIDHYNKKK